MGELSTTEFCCNWHLTHPLGVFISANLDPATIVSVADGISQSVLLAPNEEYIHDRSTIYFNQISAELWLLSNIEFAFLNDRWAEISIPPFFQISTIDKQIFDRDRWEIADLLYAYFRKSRLADELLVDINSTSGSFICQDTLTTRTANIFSRSGSATGKAGIR